jgi:transglutaminase-like putative cysteine protease
VQHLIHNVPAYELPPQFSEAQSVATFLRRELEHGSLRYIPDPEGCDLWGPPTATLMRGGGDCDDLAALAVSLLHAMNISSDMVVGIFCNDRTCAGHAWAEGHDRQGYFVIEATSGRLFRYRPKGYNAQYKLRPGACYDIRTEATKQAARQVLRRVGLGGWY